MVTDRRTEKYNPLAHARRGLIVGRLPKRDKRKAISTHSTVCAVIMTKTLEMGAGGGPETGIQLGVALNRVARSRSPIKDG